MTSPLSEDAPSFRWPNEPTSFLLSRGGGGITGCRSHKVNATQDFGGQSLNIYWD